MNWDRIEGKWKEMKGDLRQKWADMTDSDFDKIGGKKDELSGWLQNKYGYAKDRADQEIEAFSNSVEEREANRTNDTPLRQ
jgi:uncharacterized protein YjbJ (UPF0337 family)